jgi:hypothetical protein
MITNILIAIAAGCASALMYASIISGVLMSVLLVYFSSLPLMVAALGWGSASALLGGMSAGVVLAAGVNFTYGLSYVLTVAAPAFWLGHISLLAQPATAPVSANGQDAGLEWYPIGRVLAWAAVLAALVMIFAWLASSSSSEDITARLREQALQSLDAVSRGGLPIEDKERMATVMARVLPLAAVSATVVMYLLNLWIAGKVANTSRLLRRPWPDIHSVQLPQTAMVALAAALLLSFVGGFVALMAQIVGAALVTAYALVGFAVLHALTRHASTSARLWWRLSAYAAILMFIWPLVLMPILGLVDAVFGLRRRFGKPAGPTTPSS